MSDLNIQRLPKWAQEHIANLERERNRAESALKDYLDDKSKSEVWTMENFDEFRYLQTDRVEFSLGNGVVSVRVIGDKLELMAHGPCASICIMPRVTNVIEVSLK